MCNIRRVARPRNPQKTQHKVTGVGVFKTLNVNVLKILKSKHSEDEHHTTHNSKIASTEPACTTLAAVIHICETL